MRRRYPSDLTTAQWREVERCLPLDHTVGRHRTTDLREVVNAVNYRWCTGCTWRMLPHDFPPWGTVYAYQRRWLRDGTLAEIREVLLRRAPRERAEAVPA